MLKIKEYIKAESLEQAYELNQKKTNCVLGGMLWLKMGERNVQTAIDLSGLSLDRIEENEEAFSIGCMVTLRQLEEHEGLHKAFEGAVRESVRSIVGVQFRNLATIGGSLFGRFGFSDVLTCFLPLDAYVELYGRGIVPLHEFAGEAPDRDILVRVILKKKPVHCCYLSYRNSRTDFPVLTCMTVMDEERVRAAIGARPGRAILAELEKEELTGKGALFVAEKAAKEIPMQSNMRASADYRSHLARVLLERGLLAVEEKEKEMKACRR